MIRSLRWVAAVAVVLPMVVAGPVADARTEGMAGRAASSSSLTQRSTAHADDFLGRMTDRAGSGRTPRLVRSFTGGPLGRRHFTDSVTYDDALVIEAFLAQGGRADLRRAIAVGDGLRFAQRYDPAGDGRVRAAYAPAALTSPGRLHITDRTSDVGNMAWVGLAWARLSAVTGDHRFLSAARRIARWMIRHARDSRGAGGFTGGISAAGHRIRWKSTEHNIDLYALFRSLAQRTGSASYRADAASARRFVVSMWHRRTGDFYVGTGTDGHTPNRDEHPEDVNSWAYLALHDPAYSGALNWDVVHLRAADHGLHGVSFCSGDTSGVWFEGTAHLAAALELRGTRRARREAAAYLHDIRRAQSGGPNADGYGIIAASRKLSDCDGDHYFPSLHTGATAWYLLAARHVDPFRTHG